MATLLVPPTKIVTENPEWPRQIKSEAQSFLNSQILNVGSTPPTDPKAGVQSLTWPGPGDAILHTTLVLAPKTPQPQVWGRWAVLVGAKDCLHLGAWWQWDGSLPGIPTTEKEGGVLRTQKQGVTPPGGQGPVGWRVDIRGSGALRFQEWALVALSDALVGQNKMVVHNATRFYCGWTGKPPPQPLPKTIGAYPARPHGVFHLIFNNTSGVQNWPQGGGQVIVSGGVFGQKPVPQPKDLTPNSPLNTQGAVAVAQPLLGAITAPLGGRLQVTKRQGRWIYLNRGRAWGLSIGQWLVTPGGAKMHVIQFAPGEPAVDVAIAYLRSEKTPVQVGDTADLDPTVFGEGEAPSPLATPPGP